MGRKANIADDLVGGFTELADALESDRDIGATFNCYQMLLDLRPDTYTPNTVKTARKAIGRQPGRFRKVPGSHGQVGEPMGARRRRPESDRMSLHGRDSSEPGVLRLAAARVDGA